MRSEIKKIAAINDLSGIGRCSLTVAIPIFSALGMQCCPFPTAILSCQTAFDEFSFLDFTSEMKKYKNVWDNLNLRFDCIYSGFLGSEKQIDIVSNFINNHKESLVIIDPVMGDDGCLYSTYNINMCMKIKKLIIHADVITPNLTEACILADNDYKSLVICEESLENIAKKLADLGPKKIIITGIKKNNEIWNFVYNKEEEKYFIVKSKYGNKYYGGTGDIFASIVSAMILKGINLKEAVERASSFIYKAIEFTSQYDVDSREGIIFEPFLKELIFFE